MFSTKILAKFIRFYGDSVQSVFSSYLEKTLCTESECMASLRKIKKYPNRRLYDTEQSRYITVADVRDLVVRGVGFKVVDTQTNEDLTRSVLLQIIMEQENGKGEPLFSTKILAKFIQFYGDSVQSVFSSYLEKSLNLFTEQQTQLQKQVENMVTNNPVDAMTDLSTRNLEIWRDMQDNFFKAAGVTNRTRDSDSSHGKQSR